MKTLEERFWEKVDKSGGDDACWIWKSKLSYKGYGQFNVKPKLVYAHRFSWLLAHGASAGDMFVCHHCDNPRCVNPKHLFLGTNQENVDDMIRKHGRRGGQSLVYSAKLSIGDVMVIIEELKAGKTCAEIARAFNVGRTTISEIKNNHHWTFVPRT